MSRTATTLLDRMTIVLGVTLVVATGVVLVANDGQSADARTEQSAGPASAVDTVQIKDFLFEPAAVAVPVGTKLTFTNQDSAPHTATSGPSSELRGVFDTGNLTQGQSKTVTLEKAGTFAYFCELHAFMKGTVIVE